MKLRTLIAMVFAMSAMVCLVGLRPAEAGNGNFAFTKYVDTSTLVPGTTTAFSYLGSFSMDDGVVAFTGVSGSNAGIYLATPNGVTKVVDKSATAPNGTGNFVSFGSPSIENGQVAFEALTYNASIGYSKGIYTNVGGTLTAVADTKTFAPNNVGRFTDFGDHVTLRNGKVAFAATSSSSQGMKAIYTNVNGSIQAVADSTTIAPDTGLAFGSVNAASPGFDGGNVVFTGASGMGQIGIYQGTPGYLQTVANAATPVPGRVGAYMSSLSNEVISNGTVAFYNQTSNFAGIYKLSAGQLSVVADQSMSVPQVGGKFVNFGACSLDDGHVAFVASDGGRSGLFTDLTGTLDKVIYAKDMLDGKPLYAANGSVLLLGNQGISGDQIAFRALFEDNSQAIYIAAPVPEPCTFALLGMGVTGLLCCAWRRKTV